MSVQANARELTQRCWICAFRLHKTLKITNTLAAVLLFPCR